MRDVFNNEQLNIEDVDTVVFAWFNVPDNALYRNLKQRVKELYMVGDCVAPRKAIDAIFEGHKIGNLI